LPGQKLVRVTSASFDPEKRLKSGLKNIAGLPSKLKSSQTNRGIAERSASLAARSNAQLGPVMPLARRPHSPHFKPQQRAALKSSRHHATIAVVQLADLFRIRQRLLRPDLSSPKRIRARPKRPYANDSAGWAGVLAAKQ